MGALRDSARSLGDELGDYYVAALEFIDPGLAADSPLEDILAAANRRRRKLNERPLYQAEDELNALEEALHFVQRVRTDLPSASLNPSANYIDVDIDGTEPIGISPTELWARALSPASAPPAVEPEPVTPESGKVAVADPAPEADKAPLFSTGTAERQAPAKAAGKSTRAKARPVAPPPGQEWVIPADRTRAAAPEQPVTVTESRAERRSLRAVMEDAHRTPAGAARRLQLPMQPTATPEPADEARLRRKPAPVPLPEAVAWPVVAGLGLITWQAWLAAFAGWTATRFFVWPRPGIGYDMGGPATVGLVLLALATAAVTGRTVWLQRRRTRSLAFLAHLSTAVIALDLIAWHRAAGHLGALIDGPTAIHYVLLGIGWAVAWALTGIHDMVQKRNAGRRG